MGLKLNDWECDECHDVSEQLVWVDEGEDRPTKATLDCDSCSKDTVHSRRMSAPAEYLYDRPYAPMVQGGKFDTTGNRKPPAMAELPGDASMDQARDYFQTAQFKEIKEARHATHLENSAKKARAAAMKNHPTMDIRNTPLPGDPSFS